MQLFRPTDLHARLAHLGVHAKKRLSQNFLIDGNIVRKIVQAAEVTENDIVLEIGPGPGALTQALLAEGASVIAIEMDKVFANSLQELCENREKLQIFQEDFLNFPLQTFLQERLPTGKKCKIVANLPYHITTPILALVLPLYEMIETVTVMVQKEVADRFIADKGTSEYSSFTIFLEFFSKPTYAFTVEPTCFFPRPKVRSAVVNFTLHKPPIENDYDAFFQLTRSAFSQRRKMLKSTLKKAFPIQTIEEALESLGCPLTVRPEELSLDQFIKLYNKISPARSFIHES